MIGAKFRSGIDEAWQKPPVSALLANHVEFVAGYLSWDTTGKNITKPEVQAYLGAGISVILVWEFNANDMLAGYPRGKSDAAQARTQAKALGLWPCPIYFACDFDATPGNQTSINNYLKGAAKSMGWGWARLGRKRLGFYGGFWPASRARAAKLVTYIWGTLAWSGTNWSSAPWSPHIMQGTQTVISGAQVDLDSAQFADFGQMPRPRLNAGTWTSNGTKSLIDLSGDLKVPVSTILKWTSELRTPATFSNGMSAFIQQGDLTKPVPVHEKIAITRP